MTTRAKLFLICSLYVLTIITVVFTFRYGIHNRLLLHGLGQLVVSPEGQLAEVRFKREVLMAFFIIAPLIALTLKLMRFSGRFLFTGGVGRFLVYLPIFILGCCALLLALLHTPPGFLGNLTVEYREKSFSVTALLAIISVTVLAVLMSLFFQFFYSLFSLPQSIRSYLKGRGAQKRKVLFHTVGALIEQGNAEKAKLAIEKMDPQWHETLLLKKRWGQSFNDPALALTAIAQLLNEKIDVKTLNALLYEAFVLLRQRGEFNSCLEHAKKAYEYSNRAFWIYDAFLSHAVAKKEWVSCLELLEGARRSYAVSHAQYRGKKAAVLTAKALSLLADGHTAGAVDCALEALREKEDFLPAHVALARAQVKEKAYETAIDSIRSAWMIYQHPYLTWVYSKVAEEKFRADRDAVIVSDAIGLEDQDVVVTDTVVDAFDASPDAESTGNMVAHAAVNNMAVNGHERRMLVASIALIVGELKEARTQLYPLTSSSPAGADVADLSPSRRSCVLMAKLEQAEGQMSEAIRWSMLALELPEDPCWQGALGYKTSEWEPINPKTGFFDELIWK